MEMLTVLTSLSAWRAFLPAPWYRLDAITPCVSTTGQVFCFVLGFLGRLGLGITLDDKQVNAPQVVAGLPRIVSVSCRDNFTMCVGADGSL